MEYNIFFKIEEGGKLPSRVHNTDAGFDLYLPDDLEIPPLFSKTIDIKVRIAKIETNSKNHIVGIIKSRSGLAVKSGIECSNAGVIDNDYRGTLKVKLYNTTNETVKLEKYSRIAQIVFLELPRINVFETDIVHETQRNENGLGSSGI